MSTIKVKKIEELGYQDVYDLHIDSDDSSYHVNNIPVHNSKKCSSRDGKRFCMKLTDIPSDYKPAIHFRCRSVLTYQPNNYKSQNTRASKQYNADGTSKGKQIKDMSYSEWFAFQPKEIQKKYLGKKNFKLYEHGVKFEELFRSARRFSLNDVDKMTKEIK